MFGLCWLFGVTSVSAGPLNKIETQYVARLTLYCEFVMFVVK